MTANRQRKRLDRNAWLTTYSDMVTLLLCFFVLMYAFSTTDVIKWQLLVKNLNPAAVAASQDDGELPGAEASGPMAEIETLDQLYWQMKEYIEKNGLTDDVEVRGGPGYTFLVFRNNIFFDGDRYALKPEGREILDVLSAGVSAVSGLVGEMRILGHTNQADPNRENEARGDRFLASNRATEVLVYLQEKGILEPKKLVSIGYGQFYPVAPFEREEDRLKNRRVEILITEANAGGGVSPEQIYAQIREENTN